VRTGILINFLFILLSFFLPFQLSYHLRGISQKVYGLSIDYLIPAIYVTDVIIVFLLIFTIFDRTKKIKLRYLIKPQNILITVGISTFVILNLYSSDFSTASWFKWIKTAEIIVLFFIQRRYRFDIYKHFLLPLSYSVLIVTCLAIAQYFKHGSIGGLFYIFGERILNFGNAGISPHPYSTFSHPNSLAGFLVLYLFLIFSYRNKFKKPLFYLVFALSVIVICLTGSLNALGAIILSVLAIKFNFSLKKVVFLAVILSVLFAFFRIKIIDDKSYVERFRLSNASLHMITKSPLVGLGLNNFIPELVKVRTNFENSWELQPVHNIFLLLSTEKGLIGLIIVIYLLSLISETSSFLLFPVVFSGMFDHYWFTLQQNILILAIVIGFIFVKIKKNKD